MTSTPPEAPETNTGITPPAVSSCPDAGKSVRLETLRKRPEFQAASRARRQATETMVVQARRRPADHAATGIRVGYTCSKKVGNSVARNRAKRRLREVARLTLPTHGRDGYDYVLIGRRDLTAARDFAEMCTDLERALEKAHAA